ARTRRRKWRASSSSSAPRKKTTRGIQMVGRARVTMSESELNNRIETLRQEALAKVRAEELEEALALYDEALGLAKDEEVRELITINKAETLIAVNRGGPEVQALP